MGVPRRRARVCGGPWHNHGHHVIFCEVLVKTMPRTSWEKRWDRETGGVGMQRKAMRTGNRAQLARNSYKCKKWAKRFTYWADKAGIRNAPRSVRRARARKRDAAGAKRTWHCGLNPNIHGPLHNPGPDSGPKPKAGKFAWHPKHKWTEER